MPLNLYAGILPPRSAIQLPFSSYLPESLKWWGKVNALKQRTKVDWTQEVRDLLEIDYPNARKIILVYDNQDTHTIGGFSA